MATLKDLSEYTGYSIATISRILNSDPSMSASEETRKKVLEAADLLNYAATKSRKGRNLKTVLSLGIAISCPHPRIQEYYERLWRSSIGRVCRDMKIEPIDIFFNEGGDLVCGPSEIDGIFAIGVFQDAQIEKMFRLSRNVVFLDTSPDELHCDAVVINCHAGVAQLMEHLTSYGHTHIGYIGPCIGQYCLTRRITYELLYGIYMDAMQICGLAPYIWSLDVGIDAQETCQALLAYARNGGELPTALFTVTEENAVGVLAALKELDIPVPEGISVIAFSNAAQLPRIIPALTTIHVQAEEMCRAAVRLIGQHTTPGHMPSELRATPHKVMIPPTLITRESVAQPRGN